MPSDDIFSLAHYRPLYLMGGPGTQRMLRLKFMDPPIDSHDFAHSIEGAERVAKMGFNWVFLAFNWGFPPEVEKPDWESFRAAVQHYHRVGIRVIGSVQSSNCVLEGSYQEKDWYALDPDGRRIPFYRGRYYTSLCHAGWLAEVRSRVRALIETEADGIFFDNLWLGGAGVDISEMPLGPIGSYDEYSRKAYAESFNGEAIPLVLDLRDPKTQQYLRWRTEMSAAALRDWVQTARDLNPSIHITANNYDPIAKNSYVTQGFDLELMADIQDSLMLEDYALPHIQEDDSVVANAITIDAARVRSHATPITTLPYLDGVGFDGMWTATQFQRALAESTALDAAMVVKGAGYLRKGEFTSLLHSRYEQQRTSIQEYNTWLVQQQGWLSGRQSQSPLAVYHPFEAARWDWNRISSIFFAACEALLVNGYPLRIVGDDDDWSGVTTVIVPPGEVSGLEQRLNQFQEGGGRVIPLMQPRPEVTDLVLWKGWRPFQYRVPHWRWIRRRLNQGARICWRAYHDLAFARWFSARLKMHKVMNRSPLYSIVPPPVFQSALLDAIGREFYPRVESEAPVLLTVWQEPDQRLQWHLVNYAETTQRVTLHLGDLTSAWVYTPGTPDAPNRVVGSAIVLTVDVAKVLRSSHDEQEGKLDGA